MRLVALMFLDITRYMKEQAKADHKPARSVLSVLLEHKYSIAN